VFFLRLVITALRSLDANFLRSVLAALGVVIGVMAIISAMSIMEGQQEKILGKFQALGSNVVYVVPQFIMRTVRMGGVAETLKLKDIPKLKEECDLIDSIAPVVYLPQTLKYFNRSAQVVVRGTTTEFADMHNFEMDSGRFLSPEESESQSSTVVVIGYSVADKLFSGTDPVGRSIKIDNKTFRVIGVLKKHGAGSWADVDGSAYIPVRTALKRVLRQKQLHRLDIRGNDPDKLKECERQVEGILRRLHGVRAGEKADFEIFNEQRWRETFNESKLIMSAVFYSITGISLLVGGIGITNIMLVSVTERTREIGVRLAVGARQGDILFQFLVEALIISAVGGVGGILMGMMFANVLEAVLPTVIEVHTSAEVIAWAVGVAMAVGLISGLYPAYKASRKDPVEALRFE